MNIDEVKHIHHVRKIIQSKKSLHSLYCEFYAKYLRCLAKTPKTGIVLELGSGGGFAKKFISELVTSDILPYDGVDQVIDATKMPFEDNSLRAIFMLNVFHHIASVELFFQEINRCLKPQGRVFIIDQHPGLFAKYIYKYLHHEPFRPESKEWSFSTTGPLSGANGALAWIVFQRDKEKFNQIFPQLKIVAYQPHTSFRYWLTGGLKSWNLMPHSLYKSFSALDHVLTYLHQDLGSFVDIEIVKQ